MFQSWKRLKWVWSVLWQCILWFCGWNCIFFFAWLFKYYDPNTMALRSSLMQHCLHPLSLDVQWWGSPLHQLMWLRRSPNRLASLSRCDTRLRAAQWQRSAHANRHSSAACVIWWGLWSHTAPLRWNYSDTTSKAITSEYISFHHRLLYSIKQLFIYLKWLRWEYRRIYIYASIKRHVVCQLFFLFFF